MQYEHYFTFQNVSSVSALKSSFSFNCPTRRWLTHSLHSVSLYFSFLFIFFPLFPIFSSATCSQNSLPEWRHNLLSQFNAGSLYDLYDFKTKQPNMQPNQLNTPYKWCVALIALAAVRRALSKTHFFMLKCCKDLCRDALCFSKGTVLMGNAFLSNGLMLIVYCLCPFSLHTKLVINPSGHPVK